MSASEHTPTPWRVVEKCGPRPALCINGPNGHGSIAKLYNRMGWLKDAAFIVRAVNAHDDMKAALTLCAERLEALEEDGISDAEQQALEAARAAIAKAHPDNGD